MSLKKARCFDCVLSRHASLSPHWREVVSNSEYDAVRRSWTRSRENEKGMVEAGSLWCQDLYDRPAVFQTKGSLPSFGLDLHEVRGWTVLSGYNQCQVGNWRSR